MEPKLTSMDKLTRPDPSGTFPREGLFRALDGAAARPVVWVSAPAGSGKTTLVSGWIESRGLPCLWYQVDEGDSDPASLFYYLGRAAMQADPELPSLPHFTPEYQLGIPTFSRSFFEQLSRRLKTPFALVFDECERLSDSLPAL